MADAPGTPDPTISTHVLDTERGLPAAGVRVTLYRLDVGEKPIRMTQALTDGDGRVRDLLERPLAAGDYRLEFDVADEDGRSSTSSRSTCGSPTSRAATTSRCCWRRSR